MLLNSELGLKSKIKRKVSKEDWFDLEFCLEAVKENGLTLYYVQNQTPEICLEAVNQDPWALRFVQNQTDELCLEAVNQDPWALEYVKNQTLEIIQAALNEELYVVDYIDTNVLPISQWDIKWFKYISNVELKRKFIKERGKEIFKELNPEVIQENNEYTLIKYKLDDISKALVFKCPSSGDTYFQEIDPEINDLENALKFLNNGLKKEELAYES